MISSYIKCPKLLSECQRLAESDVKEYICYLEMQRYSTKTIISYVSSVVHFFSWRRKINGVQPTTITDKLIGSFLSRHLKSCKCPSSFHRGQASCAASLRLWRRIIESEPPSIATENDKLFDKYDDYLESVVGLVKSSRQAKYRHGRDFVTWLKRHLAKDVGELTLQDLAAYVYQRSSNLAPGSVTAMVSALGCFVTYLSSNCYCSISLPIYIPRPKPLYIIPVYEELSSDELEAVLLSFNRSTSIGKRDYGMACCLIELGLRTSDTAHLSLDGIDWRHRVLTLESGKNRRQLRLPISDRLFDALVDYVQSGRPSTTDRALFVYHRAPLGQAVSASTVRGAIRRSFARAGISPNRRQLHRFRHTMATRLLNAETPIKSIADVLGHQSIEASNRYAHVDINRLRSVGLPWPDGGES